MCNAKELKFRNPSNTVQVNYMAEERNKHDSMYVKVMNYASSTLIAVI